MANELGTREQPGRENMRIFLEPIAAASILGLFAFAGATWVIGAQYAGWFSGGMLPGAFLAVFGGIAQILAAMWAYKNRDGLMTAFHGVWGAFWLAFGIQHFIYSMGVLPNGTEAALATSVGYWFIPMAFISAFCAVAALATNLALFSVMTVMTAGSVATAIGVVSASTGTLEVAGYLLMISAFLGWYTAGAMVLEDAFGFKILPVGEFRMSAEEQEVSAGIGEPGVLHGQWGAFNRKRVHQRISDVGRRGPAPPVEA
jgi:succinate-acetate transporter protein